jgi:hypothetical protein
VEGACFVRQCSCVWYMYTLHVWCTHLFTCRQRCRAGNQSSCEPAWLLVSPSPYRRAIMLHPQSLGLIRQETCLPQ